MSKTKVIDHVSRLEWDHNGKCKYRVMKTKKCTGRPGWSGGCPGRWSDEYTSNNYCEQCMGRGEINYYVFMPVPKFDAPTPKAGWVPNWIED